MRRESLAEPVYFFANLTFFWQSQLNLLLLLMGSQAEHHNAMMCQHKTLIYNRSAGITMGNNQIARAAISPGQIKVYKIATIGD